MLYLDSMFEAGGLTLFREYSPSGSTSTASNRYLFMPRNPQLVMEAGQPLFQLLIYRRDITDNPEFNEGDRPGGAFLTMTVGLGVPQSTLDAVKAELERLTGGEVELAPVPFEEGSVRISALGASAGRVPGLEEEGEEETAAAEAERGPRFVEKIIGTSSPNLYPDYRSVFQIELDHEGAQLMRASLEDPGATQIAVAYDLAYRGLMPAYEAKITIDFKQSYSYLRTRFAMNTLAFKSDLDGEFERLQKEGHIKIESADYLQSDPAKLAEHAEKLNTLAKELATWAFFKPGLTPGRVLAEDRGTLTVYDPTEDAKKNDVGFTSPILAAGTGKGSPADVAGPRNQGDSANPSTTRVGGEPAPPPAAAPAEGDATAAKGAGGAVEAWNKMGRPQAAFLLKSLSQEEQQIITYDLRQVAATVRRASPQGSIRVMPGATQLPGRIKEVDLNAAFFDQVAGTVTTTADLASAGVTSMLVKLRYGVRDDGTAPKDTKEIPLVNTGDSGSYTFFMDRRHSVELEYQVIVNYKAGFAIGDTQTQSTSPWIRTTTRNLDIDPRSVGVVFPVNLVLGAVDWQSVRNIQSTVRYQSDGVRGERTVLLTEGSPAAVVPVRPPDGQSRKFTVSNRFFYETAEEVVELEGEGDSTVVVNPPTARAVPISITAADPLGRLRKVSVELSYTPGTGQPEQSRLVELPGDGASAAWTLFRPDDRTEARYRHRETLFAKNGTTDTGDWEQTIERQLIVGDVFEGLLEVEARILVPDFASIGYMGAKLHLEYPDAPPQADGSVEKFFTGPPEPFVWRVPKKPGGSGQYQYTVQWVRTNSTIETVGPVTSAEELLLLFPPVGG
jgi:hypothetical protein